MDCENQEKDKDGNPTATGAFNNSNTNNSECSRCCGPRGRSRFLHFQLISRCSAGIQTIDSTQALFLPIGASVSLLVMFFFFDSVQVVFTICTAGEHALPIRRTTRATSRVAKLTGSIPGLTAVLCFPAQFSQQLRLHSSCCQCAST